MQSDVRRALTTEESAALIRGKIRPVNVPFAYRAGLVGCTLGLLFLQLVYLALIALVAYGVAKYVIVVIPAILGAAHINLFVLLAIV